MKKRVLVALLALLDLVGCSPEDPQHDRHVEPDGHAGEVHLSEVQIGELGIEVREASPASLALQVQLPGEILMNADQVAHIVPRVPGVVRDVKKRIGDRVEADEVMAVLESRDLATAKAKYLAAQSRVVLSEATHAREESLWKKKVGSEQDFLQAQNTFEEAKISLREAKQALFALGLSEHHVDTLGDDPDTTLTRYEIRAPIAGEVVDRHVVRGELLKEDSQAFVVADLGSVWVNLTVYQKDLAVVAVGQVARIVAGAGIGEATGKISYVSPLVEEATRTATARVVLENDEGSLRPGLFVTASILSEEILVAVAVPRSALVEIDGKTVVFVATDDGFAPREVRTGRSDSALVEILSGLSPRERYVAEGSFSLKAELQKESFGGDGHGH